VNEARDVAEVAGTGDIVTSIDFGNPAKHIVHYCRDNDGDLIVMGRRGLGDIASLLMGSVSHKATRLAPRPCRTVPTEQ
jgi:nucleotide-binding universal stress UspA family protein